MKYVLSLSSIIEHGKLRFRAVLSDHTNSDSDPKKMQYRIFENPDIPTLFAELAWAIGERESGKLAKKAPKNLIILP